MRNLKAVISNPNDFKSCSGDKFQQNYTSKFASNGEIVLTPTDKVDISLYINSQAPMCDMNYIVSRLLRGDTSVCRTDTPCYGDFTNFPTSFAEMVNFVDCARKSFEALPSDVRAKFDNNYIAYMSSAGTDEWLAKFASPVKEKLESGVKEVLPDVS